MTTGYTISISLRQLDPDVPVPLALTPKATDLLARLAARAGDRDED